MERKRDKDEIVRESEPGSLARLQGMGPERGPMIGQDVATLGRVGHGFIYSQFVDTVHLWSIDSDGYNYGQ